MALTERKQINDEMCVYYFRNDTDNSIVEEYDTKEEYNRRFLSGRSDLNPTKPGHTFVSACRATKFDTASGILQDGDYGLVGDRVFFKHEGKNVSVKKDTFLACVGRTTNQAKNLITESGDALPDTLLAEFKNLTTTIK